jgi:hypothetical protein
VGGTEVAEQCSEGHEGLLCKCTCVFSVHLLDFLYELRNNVYVVVWLYLTDTVPYHALAGNLCIEGYALAADNSCTQCQDGSAGLIFYLTTFFIVFILTIALYWKRLYLFKKFQEMEEYFMNKADKYDMKSFKNKGKILFSFLQIISSMPTALNLAYPSPFNNTLEISSFSNVNVLSLFSFGCVFKFNFYDELW